MISKIEKKINVVFKPFDHAVIENILPVDIAKKAESESINFNKSIDSSIDNPIVL